jgi:uncharacterized protein (TIGR02145 family)
MKCYSFVIFFLLFFVACTDYVGQIDEQIDERNAHERARDESMIPASEKFVEPCKTDTSDTCKYGTFEDERDGQVYKTVTIGSLTWLAENLNYEAVDSYCYEADIENCTKYGRLYKWAVAMDSAGEFGSSGKGCGFGKLCAPTYPVRGICPEGWHLPSYGEWHALFAAVNTDPYGGFFMISGAELKSKTGWEEDYGEDSYGFAALPAGAWMSWEKGYQGEIFYRGKGYVAYFWMATEENRNDAYSFILDSVPQRGLVSKEYGYSVRCVKDVTDKNPRSSSSAKEQDKDENPQSSSSNDDPSVSCEESDLWCKNSTYRVYTGTEGYDDDAGYWWVEDDHAVDGTSEIEWPAPRGNEYSDLAFDSIIDYCKGLCGTVNLVKGGYYNDPFVELGVDISSTPVDVSGWDGICITYMVSAPASLVLRFDRDMEISLASDVPRVSLSKEASAAEKCFAWQDFKQVGWGAKGKISGEEAAKKLKGIAFMIQDSDGTVVDFNIIRLRKVNPDGEAVLASSSSIEYGTLVDSRDGRTYKTVTIGTQVWMAENLGYDAEGSICRDNPDDCEKYGRYYTWAIAMDSIGEFSDNGLGCGYDTNCEPTYPVRGICPEGWHLPNGEFGMLIETAGGESAAAEKLKSTSGWDYYENGDDVYGFNALPAGGCGYDGCGALGGSATFWTAGGGERERELSSIFSVSIDYGAFTTDESRYYAFSVRCVKD